MQIATLSYQYDPKDNSSSGSRAKLQHRQVLTTITNPQQQQKPRRSLFSDLSGNSNVPLPPIKKTVKRPNSIRIKGSSISSKVADTSVYSCQHQPRAHSRQSNISELSRRSRSVTPGGTLRAGAKLTRLKFGYPVTLRSAEFYGPSKNETELRIREESFVNDSVRAAHQSRRASLIPEYEPLDDPHLRRFFQSPIVLDIVRQSLNNNPNSSFKQDDRLSKVSKFKKRSSIHYSAENLSDDYLRLVTKGSSGYGRLNGYNCIPSYAPARLGRRRSSTVDPTMPSSKRWDKTESRLHRSTTQDKSHASANTSVTSYPVDSTIQEPKKNKSYKYEKSKQPKPIATSPPLRHPSRRIVEKRASNSQLSSTSNTNGHIPENASVSAITSNISQDQD
ncbi:unnamed protein product [Rotaria socialis]|uniref:Uncharacterized protein n=1 Tax=Rotaria socialis TaxID=392032 RepID=A0A820SHV8_9BILA|nr:unnamed protein product [Rotaria socialis]CAF3229975.1 unnamed protein product [Rotaria socialis]CAF3661817.1 unnamed protein product [Rotaria socialis]CAF3767353.1 unnamed protein product [Rotaria socialis]CAF4122832.1 unnamed protein product [Rotaria socialis]